MVPSIFPQCAGYYPQKIFRRKSTEELGIPLPTEEEKNQSEEETEINFIEENNTTTDNVGWSINRALDMVKMPVDWVICNRLDKTKTIVVHIDEQTVQVDRIIIFEEGVPPTVKINNIDYDISAHDISFQCVDNIQKFMDQISLVKPCKGTGLQHMMRSVCCLGGLSSSCIKRCKHCNKERDKFRKREVRKRSLQGRQGLRVIRHKKQIKSLRRSQFNLLTKVNFLLFMIKKSSDNHV